MNAVSIPLPPEARFHDPAFYGADPYDVYRTLRQRAPVYRYVPDDPDYCAFWIVSTYEHVRAVARDPQKFTSSKVLALNDLHRSFREAGTSMFRMYVPQDAVNLIFTDPPVHTSFRGLINRAFTLAAVKQLEGQIRDITKRVFNSIPIGQEFDFVEKFAAQIPSAVIASVLGLPAGDVDSIRGWLNAAISCGEEMSESRIQHLGDSMSSLWSYLADKVKERRERPGDDFISALTAATVDGQALSDPDIMMLIRALLFGGNETTRNNITAGLVTFLKNPEELAWLRSNPDKMDQAVEEVLRYCNPSVGLLRTATQDVELGGQHIRAGEPVLMLQASANRDEAVWPDADRFNIRRKNSPAHLSFGHGVHFCVGAALARMQLRIVFQELLGHFGSIRIMGAPRVISSSLITSIPELPVVFEDGRG